MSVTYRLTTVVALTALALTSFIEGEQGFSQSLIPPTKPTNGKEVGGETPDSKPTKQASVKLVVRIDSPRRGGFGPVAFSPDGNIVAYISSLQAPNPDSQGEVAIVICDAANGKELRRIRLPGARYIGSDSLRFSQDGKKLAWISGQPRQEISVWHLISGKRLDSLVGFIFKEQYLTSSPDGKILARMSKQQEIEIQDQGTRKSLGTLNVQPFGLIESIAISTDGKTLLAQQKLLDNSGNSEKGKPSFKLSAHLWDIESGKHLGQPIPETFFLGEGRIFRLLGAEPEGFRVRKLPDDRLLILPHYRNASPIFVKGRDLSGRQFDVTNLLTRAKVYDFPEFKEGWIFSWDIARDTSAFAASGLTAYIGNEMAVFLWDLTALHGQVRLPGTKYSAEELARLWVKLASGDGTEAHQAMCLLAVAPEQTVALLKAHLQPDAERERRLLSLVAELRSDKVETRETASLELAKLGESARPALNKALAGVPPMEQRRRVNQLLEKLGPCPPSLEEMRVLRALDLLEHIATEKAKQVLTAVAEGPSVAVVTQVAQQTLERLAKKGRTTP